MRPRALWIAAIVVVGVILLAFNMYHKYGGTRQPSISSSSLVSSMATSSFTLTSTAFANNAAIPSIYTCDGDRKSPPLDIGGVPDGAVTLALLVEDPDVPKQLMPAGMFDHWVLYNIPPSTTAIPEGGSVGVVGTNTAGNNEYAPPCPPKQYEPARHRYIFRLYALTTKIALPLGAKKDDVLQAMKGHVIAQAVLTGTYERP